MSKLLILTVLALSALGLTALASESAPFDLTTTLGETYHGSRIIKVTPEAVIVAHDDGVAKVPFEILGDAWREKFHYSPDKARQFRLEEDRRIAKAEARHNELRKEYDKGQAKLLKEMADAEKKRADLAAKLASEQAAAQPQPLLPFPGDTSPLGTPYTPGVTTGPSFIINQGTVFTPGDGTLYYVNPGYPGYVYPPVIVQPPGRFVQPRGGLQQSGSVFLGNGGATGAISGGSVIIRRGR